MSIDLKISQLDENFAPALTDVIAVVVGSQTFKVQLGNLGLDDSLTPWTENIDAADFDLTNLGDIISGSSNPATSGFIRMANSTDRFKWRNAANSANFEMYMASNDKLNFGGMNVESIGSLTSLGTVANDGFIRMQNIQTVSWRNGAASADLDLGIGSDRLQFEGVTIPTISSTDTLSNKSFVTLTSSTANPAGSEVIRLANDVDKIAWRNDANNNDIELYVNDNDKLLVNAGIRGTWYEGGGIVPSGSATATLRMGFDKEIAWRNQNDTTDYHIDISPGGGDRIRYGPQGSPVNLVTSSSSDILSNKSFGSDVDFNDNNAFFDAGQTVFIGNLQSVPVLPGYNSALTPIFISGTGSDNNITFHLNDLTIGTGQPYGGIQWGGEDNSGVNNDGVRARLRVAGADAAGGVDMIFQVANGNDATPPTVMTLTRQGDMMLEPLGKLRFDGTDNGDVWISEIGGTTLELVSHGGTGKGITVEANAVNMLQVPIKFTTVALVPGVSDQALWSDAGGFNQNVPTGDSFEWRINGVAEMILDATALDLNDNNIIDIGYVESGTTPAQSGFLRMASADRISWRNNANTSDIQIRLNSNDRINFGGHSLEAIGALISTGTVAGLGFIRMQNSQSIGWRNGAASADLDLDIGSDRLRFEAVNLVGISTTDTLTNKTMGDTLLVNGNDLDSIQNIIYDLSTSGTDIDFGEDELQEISIAANTTFTGTGYAIGKSKSVKITTDGTLRTLAFPAGWVFVGTKPTDQAASKTGILTLTSYTAAEAGVVCAYAVEA